MVEVDANDPMLQPEAVISPATKLDVASLEVKVSAIAAVLVVPPLDIALELIVIVGTV